MREPMDESVQGMAAPEGARRVRLTFDSARAFEEEYARNLTKGGAFVRSQDCFELREIVEVALELPFLDETLALAAEVVHCLPPDAAPPGADPGVAVQFLDSGPRLRTLLEPLLEQAEDRSATEAAGVEADSKTLPAGSSWSLDEDLFGDDPSDEALVPARGAGGEVAPPPALVSEEAPDLALEPEEAASPEPVDVNERTHRARADRSEVRIPVSVRAPSGEELRGRARNLSETGVLLSVAGEALPLGREVTLRLVHPSTGQPIPVSGKVVRHIEGEGAVTAVAVRLEPEEPHREAVEQFVSEMGHTEREQRKGCIRGPLDEMGPVSLLQMFTGLSPRGTLTVTAGPEEGVIVFDEGALVLAQCGSVEGTKALVRIFSWQSGCFEFRGHVESVPEAERDGRPVEGAILEALRVLDESSCFTEPHHRPDARFRVDRDQLAGDGEGLDKTAEAVLDLAAAGFTVRRILDVIPDDDVVIHRTIDGLVGRGVLARAD